jgi:nucleoside-diphosphate-sugar epimerase
MATVLVIGGSGFFGKSIADAYVRGLLESWDIDRLLLAARSATALVKSHPELLTRGVELIDVDITQTTHLPWADYVIHAAASSDARK